MTISHPTEACTPADLPVVRQWRVELMQRGVGAERVQAHVLAATPEMVGEMWSAFHTIALEREDEYVRITSYASVIRRDGGESR